MVTGLLRKAVAKERDPAVADRVNMVDKKRRFQIQLYHVITMTSRRRVSLVVRRVFSSGLEAWRQLCRVFEPWVSSRFQWMLQAPLLSTRSDSSVRENQRSSGVRTSENAEPAVLQRYLRNGGPARQPVLQSGSPTMMCDLACNEIVKHIGAASGAAEGAGGKISQDGGKGVKTAKSKKCLCCVTSSHSKSEYKNFSAAVKRKFAQRGRANRHASEEVDSESDERQWLRGTGMARAAQKLDACFPHAGDDDPDEYLLPLPVIEKSDDDYTSQMRSDVSTVKQVDPSAFKPVVQIEPSEEVPVGSKFLNMGSGAQAVGGRLGVRCVAGSVIADGQVTARDQKVWLNRNDEFTLDGELANVTEESLGDNRGFIESRDQKHVCVACCKGQSSSLFPTSEQESSPRMQMDRGEIEIEEARRTREREELRSSPQIKRKTNTKSCVQYCAIGAIRA